MRERREFYTQLARTPDAPCAVVTATAESPEAADALALDKWNREHARRIAAGHKGLPEVPHARRGTCLDGGVI